MHKFFKINLRHNASFVWRVRKSMTQLFFISLQKQFLIRLKEKNSHKYVCKNLVMTNKYSIKQGNEDKSCTFLTIMTEE